MKQATVTITDNETVPSVSISSPTINEGTAAVFTVSLSSASSVDTVIDVVTTTGTAGALDYTATTAMVTIPAGSTSVMVSVPTSTDAINEPSESFTLTATVTAGTTANTTASGTATITDISMILKANDDEAMVDGINGSLEFINILSNDLLNGSSINSLDVIISNTLNSSYFEFNSDGTVNMLPNTPGGEYTLTYQVCEKANSSNCSSATLQVFVESPAIAIIKTAQFNDEDNSGYANAGETITYSFKITNTGNVPLSGIVVLDPLSGIIMSGQPISLAVNESDETNFKATYAISQSDINFGTVSNQATVTGTSPLGVKVEDQSDNLSNTNDNPTVLSLQGCAIKVFNAISPNGDGENERFYIRGLECYPDNTVEIYNRWGVLVFEKDGYNNQDKVFKGMSEGRTTIKSAEGLPVGTYYYILKYKDSGSNLQQQAGYLYINK